ncbi:unnamed protein product [Caenorhabditis auriculariae]|uniref:Potassium channel domain-containing protein n=1 Tax=Caenorhabditis auriculariae TaxID=2777116 RepID=A0A8S1HNB3_9PELO|nr:unnamed protein product [Caenorhabditis auriculariae]
MGIDHLAVSFGFLFSCLMSILVRSSTVSYRNRPSLHLVPQTSASTSRYSENAIEIEPADGDTRSLMDVDVEAGITSSRCHLMHNFEEERPVSLVASIKESAKSSTRRARHYLSYITSPLSKILSSMKLLILIAIYSVLGAYLFMYLEVPTDLKSKEDDLITWKVARENLILNLRAIYFDNREDREERWKDAILQFESAHNIEEPSVESAWTFWMSFLYAGTIYTTIGYGNIACKTLGGRIATMIYAFVGIPIMLVMLTSLNNFLLKWIRIISNFTSDLVLYIGVKSGFVTLQQGSKERLRYQIICRKLHRAGLIKSFSISALTPIDDKKSPNFEEPHEAEPPPDPPILSTLFITVGWIMLSAAVFCLFESWDYFTSFYFCFISLSTIGLGDVTPDNPQYMIATFGVVIVGLSMLTVCIDVVKEKLALMYMALLEKLLNDYMEAVSSGDPNATSEMMSGFQDKAKFLMPLISKEQGAKVMNKFKEDCTKKGIDPPPVLTNINPETGMPAFATAEKDEFRDYIEVADEKNERRSVTPEPVKRPVMITKTTLTDFEEPPPSPRKPSVSIGETQTVTPHEIVAMFSFSTQATPPNSQQAMQTDTAEFSDSGFQTDGSESSDEGIQTDVAESSDEGVQVRFLGSDISIQFDTPDVPEVPKETLSQAVQCTYVQKTAGIQPEVSSIYFADDIETDSLISEESEESEDFLDIEEEEEETPEVQLASLPEAVQRQEAIPLGKMPPIEITPESDAELQRTTSSGLPDDLPPDSEHLLSARNPLVKSVSVESQETVINVPARKKRKLTPAEKEKKREEREKRRADREARREARRMARGLRFMKNSGDQTNFEMAEAGSQYETSTSETAVQYEVFTAETSSQYDRIETRGMRSQTKLSGASKAQLGDAQEKRRRRHLRRRPTESVETGESGPDTDFERQESISEEVSLNLSVVSKAVDEQGRPVRLSKTAEELSEPEISDDELESFAVESSAQTDVKKFQDQWQEATPSTLNLLADCLTQTSISTFRKPEVTQKEGVDVEKPTENLEKAADEKISFMKESGAQTINTSFYEAKIPSQSTEDDPQATSSSVDENLLFLVDGTTQTNVEYKTTKIETEGLGSTSTNVQVGSAGRETDTQTDTQERVMRGTQTAKDAKDSENQTEEKRGKEVEIQTTGVRKWEKPSQTEDLKEISIREVQTEDLRDHLLDAEVQALSEVVEAGVDATSSSRSTQIQSEVSMFVVDEMDRTRMEVVHDVRFNVDSSTQYDAAAIASSCTQSELLEVESAMVQVTPSTTTSHTQYTNDGNTVEQLSQTEIVSVRSRASQGVSATQPTSDAASSSVSEMKSSDAQAEAELAHMAVQQEEIEFMESGVDPMPNFLVSQGTQNEQVELVDRSGSPILIKFHEVGVGIEVTTSDAAVQKVVQLREMSVGGQVFIQTSDAAIQEKAILRDFGVTAKVKPDSSEVAVQGKVDTANVATQEMIDLRDIGVAVEIKPPMSDAAVQGRIETSNTAVDAEVVVPRSSTAVQGISDLRDIGVTAEIKPPSSEVSIQHNVELREMSAQIFILTSDAAIQEKADLRDFGVTAEVKPESFEVAIQETAEVRDMSVTAEIKLPNSEVAIQERADQRDISVTAEMKPLSSDVAIQENVDLRSIGTLAEVKPSSSDFALQKEVESTNKAVNTQQANPTSSTAVDADQPLQTVNSAVQPNIELNDMASDAEVISMRDSSVQWEKNTQDIGLSPVLFVTEAVDAALSPIPTETVDSAVDPEYLGVEVAVQESIDSVTTASDAFNVDSVESATQAECPEMRDTASDAVVVETSDFSCGVAYSVTHTAVPTEDDEEDRREDDLGVQLWSDFDYIGELGLNEPDIETADFSVQIRPQMADFETQTVKLKKTSEGLELVETADSEVQVELENDEDQQDLRKKKERTLDVPVQIDVKMQAQPSTTESTSQTVKKEKKKPETTDQDVQVNTTSAVDQTDSSMQAEPSTAEGASQTVKLKKKKIEVMKADCDVQAGAEQTDHNVQARPETTNMTVQAVPEVCDESVGFEREDHDDWLQVSSAPHDFCTAPKGTLLAVYVQELDHERRLRMLDIGIQTGVLARVQHLYTRRPEDSDEAGPTSPAPVMLRKSSESSEFLTSSRSHNRSDESLARTGSVMSMAESVDERGSPFASKNPSRQSSLKKKISREVERSTERSQAMTDLRARFERGSVTPTESRENLRKTPKVERQNSSD